MNYNGILRLVLPGLLFFLAGPVRGQSLVAMSAWEASCLRRGLSEEDISALEKNRILVVQEGHKQIFSAYLGGSDPLFITSDSVLNAYHVLYEESIIQLENTMASRLPEILRLILRNMEDVDAGCKGNPGLAAAAKRRALLVSGIALRLMDESFRFGDDELDQIAAAETARIVAASGTGMPKWLGQPDGSFLSIDYSRYKPRGFYTRTDRLERYFRAVSWLQSIPFRVERDEELLAILMLGNCVTYSRFNGYEEGERMQSFFRAYSSFIGAGDDWDIMTAAHEAQNELRMNLAGGSLQLKREWLQQKAENHGDGPQINDQIRFAPDDPRAVAELGFRIVSAHRTPDAILFQRAAEYYPPNHLYPDGLMVAVALGSSCAEKNLGYYNRNKLLQAIESNKPLFRGEGLYLAYLEALSALLDAPEPDAPDFMKNEAWQTKSCNTVLAGWAQLKHTWVLQAKQSAFYACAMEIPAGFVEPEPEFFSRMAELAAATRSLLARGGAFDPDYEQLASSLEKPEGLFDGVDSRHALEQRWAGMSFHDKMAVALAARVAQTNVWEMTEIPETFRDALRQQAQILAEDLRKGEIGKYPGLQKELEEYSRGFDLDALWKRLEELNRRLETIAHKQLRKVDLNAGETEFIKGYGATIAGIMLYDGNSYVTPEDDAPRIVDVYSIPNTGGYLHVGVARPRTLYVLYPWKDQTVLCKGAVMPYYEFASGTRLTDESWKGMLDSRKRPDVPKWASPIMQGGKLEKPVLKND